MSCTDTYASAQDFANFWCIDPICDEERNTIEQFLDIAAADIHVALLSAEACDCTLKTGAAEYLKKINVIEAAVVYNCPCANPRFNQDTKQMWQGWLVNQFEMINNMTIELCAGETGANFPAVGWAEMGWTEFQRAEIVWNDAIANS